MGKKKEPEDLTVRILRELQSDMAEVKASLHSIKDEMTQFRGEVGVMHSHLAAFHTSQSHQRNDLAMLDERLRRVEKRLGIDEQEH